MQIAVAVRLNIETKARLKRLGELRDKTTHKLMLTAVNEYLDREERREAFKQEAIASHQHHKETGLHVTGDEIAQWVNSWGSDTILPAPACHK